MRERLQTHRSTVADGAVALLLFAIGLWELVATPLASDVVRGPFLLNLAAIALITLPLAARRAFPLAVALAVFATVAVRPLVAAPLELIPAFLAALIAAYSVGAYLQGWLSALGLALAVTAIEIAAAAGGPCGSRCCCCARAGAARATARAVVAMRCLGMIASQLRYRRRRRPPAETGRRLRRRCSRFPTQRRRTNPAARGIVRPSPPGVSRTHQLKL